MANGILEVSQLELLSQAGSGTITVVPPATNTNQILTLPDATGTVASLGTTLTLATPVTASGTSVDFTSIPSWVKRITVMFSGVSTSSTSNIQIQLGTAGSPQVSGYLGTCGFSTSGTTASTLFTTGFGVSNAVAASRIFHGIMTITLLNPATNSWAYVGNTARSDSAVNYFAAASVALAGVMDMARITTANGTDTFTAGSINILYEG